MKIRRALSGVLFGLGCAITFIGVMTFALPRVDNAQLQLVLASFESPSRIGLVNLISSAMRYALRHSLEVLAVGVLCLGMGGFLVCRFSEPPKAAEKSPYERPAAPPPPREEPNPFAVPETAEPSLEYSYAPAFFQEEPSASSLLTGHKPLLEENRIEEYQPHLPERFETESRAIEVETGEESPSGSRVILRTPQVLPPASEPQPVSPPSPVDVPEPITETPQEQPLLRPASPRIRSTMGQHKQW